MPTLPLYTPTDDPDASRRVIGPGGYERWHFDACSETGDLRVVADFGYGYPFDAAYWHGYRRYRRRPTRHPPPVPREHPNARAALYEAGQLAAQECNAAALAPGAVMSRSADGLSIRLGDPRDGWSAKMTFRLPAPPSPSRETSLLPLDLTRDLHRLVAANAPCDVVGTIHLPGGRQADFRGRGYHDHCYGTGPLALPLRAWTRGRAVFPGRGVWFFVGAPRAAAPPVVTVVEMSAAGTKTWPQPRVDGTLAERPSRQSPPLRGLRLSAAGHVPLELTDPRTIDGNAPATWQTCVARAGDEVGEALCQRIMAGTAGARLCRRAGGLLVHRAGGGGVVS